MKEAILVVGGEGLLGGALLAEGRKQRLAVRATMLQVPAGAAEVERLDLSGLIDEWSPPADCGSAILCAAITNLEVCRRDPAGSRFINVQQTLRLAERLAAAGVFVTFLSSNLVFDGTEPLRSADDPPCPVEEYGRQKAEVEAGLRALGEAHAVVRLTKVLHEHWQLLRDWIDALRGGRPVDAFDDMVCAPIPLWRVVCGLMRVAAERRPGLWQFSASSDASYANMARHLARRVGAQESLVRPVRAADRLGGGHLPAHTTLDAARAMEELGLGFPPPLIAVDEVFRAP